MADPEGNEFCVFDRVPAGDRLVESEGLLPLPDADERMSAADVRSCPVPTNVSVSQSSS